MSWTCPSCKRSFKHKNQEHSCVSVNIDEHFKNKEPRILRLYHTLMNQVSQFGDVSVSPAKNAILIKNESTFLAIKPKKSWIDVEFFLRQPVDELPVHKIVRASKNRVVHFVRLEKSKEISEKLLNWLRESYELTSS